jgi:hypothetical protein
MWKLVEIVRMKGLEHQERRYQLQDQGQVRRPLAPPVCLKRRSEKEQDRWKLLEIVVQ